MEALIHSTCNRNKIQIYQSSPCVTTNLCLRLQSLCSNTGACSTSLVHVLPRQVVLISADVICYYGRNSIWLAWKSIQPRGMSQQAAATNTHTDICKAIYYDFIISQRKVTPNLIQWVAEFKNILWQFRIHLTVVSVLCWLSYIFPYLIFVSLIIFLIT